MDIQLLLGITCFLVAAVQGQDGKSCPGLLLYLSLFQVTQIFERKQTNFCVKKFGVKRRSQLAIHSAISWFRSYVYQPEI
jgi:hypothetical protein